MKKLFHRSSKYSMESLSLNSLKQRWQERIANSEALHATELKEKEKNNRKKCTFSICMRKMKAEERALHQKQVIGRIILVLNMLTLM